jgi:hypothetical protein
MPPGCAIKGILALRAKVMGTWLCAARANAGAPGVDEVTFAQIEAAGVDGCTEASIM